MQQISNDTPMKAERRKNIRNNSTTFFSIKKKNKQHAFTRVSTPLKMTAIDRDQRSHKNTDKNVSDTLNLNKIIKNIPKALEYHEQDHKFIEIRFSYIDQGLQKWKIGKLIGRGNSSVRQAMNIKKGVRAAVKQVYLNEDSEKQKLKEIKILQKLEHKNIVQYYENFKVKGQTWIFMEFVEINLRKFYLTYGIPPTNVILNFAKQILEALKYLKKKKVIHKDIKCENILLDNGVLKLCDFGCSKDFESTFSLQRYQQNPQAKGAKGSYLWAAPECHQFAKFSFASDIWSFGCTLCELMSGKLPWSQKQFENEMQVIIHIAETDQTPQIDQSWDCRIKQLIKSCLKRNQEDRATAEELLDRQDLWN